MQFGFIDVCFPSLAVARYQSPFPTPPTGRPAGGIVQAGEPSPAVTQHQSFFQVRPTPPVGPPASGVVQAVELCLVRNFATDTYSMTIMIIL